MNTVVSILAAVYYREKTGRGQYLDVSMMDGTVPFLSMDGASFLAGAPAPKRESETLNGGGIYDFYKTKDGGYMSVGSLEPKFFTQLMKAVGHPEWADGKTLKDDPTGLKAELRRIFLTKTKAEWTEHFKRYDACVEPVLTPEEVLSDPHINERGLLPEVPLTEGGSGTVRQLGCPIRLSECPPEYRHAGRPEGADTLEVLGQFGYTEEDLKELGE